MLEAGCPEIRNSKPETRNPKLETNDDDSEQKCALSAQQKSAAAFAAMKEDLP